MEDEMFVSAVWPNGEQAGVFEYDGDTGFFYLYQAGEQGQRRVVAAIQTVVGEPDFAEADVEVRWDAAGNKVGLFIRGEASAVFDVETGAKYGGIRRPNAIADIPAEVLAAFGAC
jgi:hypothetical protein